MEQQSHLQSVRETTSVLTLCTAGTAVVHMHLVPEVRGLSSDRIYGKTHPLDGRLPPRSFKFQDFQNLTNYILSRWIYGFPLLSQMNTTKCIKMVDRQVKYSLYTICSPTLSIQSERDHTCAFSTSDTTAPNAEVLQVWEGPEAVMAGGRCWVLGAGAVDFALLRPRDNFVYPHNNPVKQVLSLYPFYNQENRGETK